MDLLDSKNINNRTRKRAATCGPNTSFFERADLQNFYQAITDMVQQERINSIVCNCAAMR